MMEIENNVPADDNPDGLAADERAAAEIAKEREGAAVENLTGIAEPEVDEAALARADLDAVLQQSITASHLNAREVNRAAEAARQFEQIDPAAAEGWQRWGEQSADHRGFLIAKLAAGEMPSGGPERYKAELDGLPTRWGAERELKALVKANPPGSPGYRENQARIQALYQHCHGDQPIIGRSGRNH